MGSLLLLQASLRRDALGHRRIVSRDAQLTRCLNEVYKQPSRAKYFWRASRDQDSIQAGSLRESLHSTTTMPHALNAPPGKQHSTRQERHGKQQATDGGGDYSSPDHCAEAVRLMKRLNCQQVTGSHQKLCLSALRREKMNGSPPRCAMRLATAAFEDSCALAGQAR